MRKVIRWRSRILTFVFLSLSAGMCAAQTVGITLPQAEELFLRANLQLLASRFSIDASQAAIIQARLWSNPNIAIEQNVYNPQTGRYFDYTKTGNTEVQIQQLFLLAGKRERQIRLAEINASVAQQAFFDLLRTLKYQLRKDFYDLFFLRQSIRFYDENIDSVRKTIAATEQIFQQRSILLSDVLRLKSLLFTLETEQLNLRVQEAQNQADLRVLLADTSAAHTEYIPQLNRSAIDSLGLKDLTVESAIAIAREARPDYRIADANVRYEETNLALQKSLAVPDVTVAGRWSRAGSYIPEYYGLSVSIDLPFLNRNQGNIQVSENTLEANRRIRDNVLRTIERDVEVAYRKTAEIDRLFKTFDRKFPAEYELLVRGMLETYKNRNMRIIELTDFLESYRTSVLQLNQLQNDRVDAFEYLNYVVGKDVATP